LKELVAGYWFETIATNLISGYDSVPKAKEVLDVLFDD